ncbi:NAD(P)-dependent alcohol dehydrogenase [Hyphomonas sp. ND6WE1B]|uniref:zinc-dependent alcohol dehydrogenase family protein n=1 Tax=Hyphomonas sp. ND6WE1B TaxID=1848191 RepID=UPI0008076B36|nr:NAD(P)-dependent alcohol dehydrogenase [Hyphomonas sp. ND6WE1B]
MAEAMRRWELNGTGRDRLAIVQADIPSPRPGEVLVRVTAVALNYRDKLLIDDGMGLALSYPLTPGSDLAGRVVATGDGVSRFHAEDRVISNFAPDWIDGAPQGNGRVPGHDTLGGIYPGVLAEYVAFPEDWLVRAPASLDDVQASTLPCAGLTAWFSLIEKGGLHAGETVLIEGTGGVALFGLQIAKAHGARVIIVSGSPDKLERAKSLGADHCILRSSENWVERVYQLTDDHGADHILEIVGGPHLGRAVEAAAINGRIYLIGVFDGFETSAQAGPLMLKNLVVQGIGVGHRRALESFASAVDQIGLLPVIGKTFRFEELPEALDHLDQGPFGKIVVELA